MTSFNYTDEPIDPYSTWPFRQILLGTFIPLFPLAIGGNSLVICIIVRNRSMRTVTNFFLANLAVADLMVALFCIIPQVMWFVSPTWMLGAAMCKLHKYMLGVTTKASIFIMMAISGERFVAIIYPLRIRRVLTIGRLSCILCFLWLISFLLSIPSFLFFEESNMNGTKHCVVSIEISTEQVIMHNILYFILCYLFPLFVMVFFYTRIIISLWLRGRAVYYKTSRHGEKTYQDTSAVEMEVRMHTGGSVKTHMHKAHGNSTEKCPCKPPVEDGSGNPNSERHNHAPPEEPKTLKIGPFFVDYPPPSPRRQPENFKGSKSCENVLLLSEVEKSGPQNQTLARRKSQSTGAIDHYYHNKFCEALNHNTAHCTDKCKTEMAEEARCVEGTLGNGGTVHIGDANFHDSEYPGKKIESKSEFKDSVKVDKDDKTSRPKPRPLRQRSSGLLSVKAGYECLSSIDDDEGLTTLLQPESNKPGNSGQPSGSEPHKRSNSLLTSTKIIYDKKGESRTEASRPAIMVELVPAENHNPHPKTVNRAKKISKSTIATRKKVIRMLVVLVVAFAVCLFPMELYSIWTLDLRHYPYKTSFDIIFTPFIYFAYFFNSALNPFLYALLSDNFRMRMRETLDFRGSSRRARWMRTQTRLRSLTSEGTDNDWVT